jgi:hypothetical protein
MDSTAVKMQDWFCTQHRSKRNMDSRTAFIGTLQIVILLIKVATGELNYDTNPPSVDLGPAHNNF